MLFGRSDEQVNLSAFSENPLLSCNLREKRIDYFLSSMNQQNRTCRRHCRYVNSKCSHFRSRSIQHSLNGQLILLSFEIYKTFFLKQFLYRNYTSQTHYYIFFWYWWQCPFGFSCVNSSFIIIFFPSYMLPIFAGNVQVIYFKTICLLFCSDERLSSLWD